MTTNGTTGDPPNLELLIKLMKLTTSQNDGEALAALRAANRHLITKLGSDWERLLRGKVRIIADPFANLAAPTQQSPSHGHTPPRPQPRPAPKPQPQRRPPPPPPPPAAPTWSTLSKRARRVVNRGSLNDLV